MARPQRKNPLSPTLGSSRQAEPADESFLEETLVDRKTKSEPADTLDALIRRAGV